jgi:hypothetical protein
VNRGEIILSLASLSILGISFAALRPILESPVDKVVLLPSPVDQSKLDSLANTLTTGTGEISVYEALDISALRVTAPKSSMTI